MGVIIMTFSVNVFTIKKWWLAVVVMDQKTQLRKVVGKGMATFGG